LICASVCRENSFKQTQKFNDHLEKHRAPVGAFSFATMAAAALADAFRATCGEYDVQQYNRGKSPRGAPKGSSRRSSFQ